MIDLDQAPDSSFYQLARSYLNILTNSEKSHLVLKKNFYYKKMNLSDDIAKWSGYEIFLKTETHTIISIIFRRSCNYKKKVPQNIMNVLMHELLTYEPLTCEPLTYYFHLQIDIFLVIPPLLDKRQDIYITFKISYQSQKDYNVTDKILYDELYMVANSITSNDINNIYYVNLIQAQLNSLIYNAEIYHHIETIIKIKPVYFDYVKMFLKYMLVTLKEGGVYISSGSTKFKQEKTEIQMLIYFMHSLIIYTFLFTHIFTLDIMDFLEEEIKIERDFSYLLNLILSQIPGINLIDTHISEKKKINRILHRLSDYIIYCLDTGFMSHKYNITDFINGALKIDSERREDVNYILNFFLHLRETDYGKEYEKECLKMLEIEKDGDMKINKLLSSKKYTINDFFLFYLHQSGYINKYYKYKNDNDYKKIVSYILRYGVDLKIKKSVCKNLLIFSNDYKNKYNILVNSIVIFLYQNSDRQNFCLFILSTLINITNNNDEIKNQLIKLNISKVANFFILSKDYEIVHKVILLYINLSKEEYMCDDMINNGLFINFLDILFDLYYINLKIKKEICINILCIIGQVLNYKKYAIFLLNNYIGLIEVAIYIYQTTDFVFFNKIKIIYFFKQIAKYNYIIKTQICNYIIPLVIKEIYLFSNKDFIYSVLNLLNTISDYKTNCLALIQMNILDFIGFIKSLSILDLYKKAIQIEKKIKKNLDVVS
ncbi:Nd9 protein [Plasmodium yoelii yoelii]|uniref:Nd9 protein n=1 Tax=Plasmodium yoelii yoelii TaxID=73239 RepID=A0AAE9WY38_PLAYO|nr:Nd9 protein [Plasmodium yoelii yoelii]